MPLSPCLPPCHSEVDNNSIDMMMQLATTKFKASNTGLPAQTFEDLLTASSALEADGHPMFPPAPTQARLALGLCAVLLAWLGQGLLPLFSCRGHAACISGRPTRTAWGGA